MTSSVLWHMKILSHLRRRSGSDDLLFRSVHYSRRGRDGWQNSWSMGNWKTTTTSPGRRKSSPYCSGGSLVVRKIRNLGNFGFTSVQGWGGCRVGCGALYFYGCSLFRIFFVERYFFIFGVVGPSRGR